MGSKLRGYVGEINKWAYGVLRNVKRSRNKACLEESNFEASDSQTSLQVDYFLLTGFAPKGSAGGVTPIGLVGGPAPNGSVATLGSARVAEPFP